MPKRNNHHRVLDEYLILLITQGNHEAYETLRKRYHRHSLSLANEIAKSHQKAGLPISEIIAVCDYYFPAAVSRYNHFQSSFFHYWREMTSHYVLNYIIDLCYTEKSLILKTIFSIDDPIDEKHSVQDVLAERDEDILKKKAIEEINHIVKRHKSAFEKNELSLLELMLEGYSIGELEHSGLMAKSTLYITFNIAVNKLQKIMKGVPINKI